MNTIIKLLLLRCTRCALAIALLLWCGTGYAQFNQPYISQGNSFYKQGKYPQATGLYKKAIAKNPNDTAGLYNLGNALYCQKQYDSSRRYLNAAAQKVHNKVAKGAVNYNVGNTYMQEKKWDEAINAYKTTLKNNPQDLDAKYNLAYAQKMKQQQQQQQQSGGGKNDDKNKDKDKQDDQKNKGDKDNKTDKNKDDKGNQKPADPKDGKNDQQNRDQNDQQQQGQAPKMSEKDAERNLEALQNEEKKIRDRIGKDKPGSAKPDKDW